MARRGQNLEHDLMIQMPQRRFVQLPTEPELSQDFNLALGLEANNYRMAVQQIQIQYHGDRDMLRLQTRRIQLEHAIRCNNPVLAIQISDAHFVSVTERDQRDELADLQREIQIANQIANQQQEQYQEQYPDQYQEQYQEYDIN